MTHGCIVVVLHVSIGWIIRWKRITLSNAFAFIKKALPQIADLPTTCFPNRYIQDTYSTILKLGR